MKWRTAAGYMDHRALMGQRNLQDCQDLNNGLQYTYTCKHRHKNMTFDTNFEKIDQNNHCEGLFSIVKTYVDNVFFRS